MNESLFSFNLDGYFAIAARTDELQTRYEHMDLREVAVLENVGLVYRTDLGAGPHYARNESGVYLMLDPLLDEEHQRVDFFKSLALIQLRREAGLPNPE